MDVKVITEKAKGNSVVITDSKLTYEASKGSKVKKERQENECEKEPYENTLKHNKMPHHIYSRFLLICCTS